MSQRYLEVVQRDEGDYFVATNPTAGTGIATTTSIQAEDQTKPVLLLINQGTLGDPDAKSIYIDFIHLQCAAVPTSSTDWQMSLILDQATPTKYTSGGSDIVPKCVNGDMSVASMAKLYFGAVVAVAGVLTGAVTGRVHRSALRTVIPVVGDQYDIAFGGMNSGGLINGTNPQQINEGVAPVVIPPGYCLSLCMWGASNAGASTWELTAGWTER